MADKRQPAEHQIARNTAGRIISQPKLLYDNETGEIMEYADILSQSPGFAESDNDSLQAHVAWIERVKQIGRTAKKAMPGYDQKIDDALALVLAGHVHLGQEPGTYAVRSQSNPQQYYTLNGVCPCLDATKNGEKFCKHRLAAHIWARANEPQEASAKPTPAPPAPSSQGRPPTYQATSELEAAILQAHSVEIHGTQTIRYAGLLLVAHQRGLLTLTEEWVDNTAELSLAKATALFRDGSTWQAMADATPQNVLPTVKPHFRRVALTRAKARCLRDALGIDLVSTEELGD